MERTFIADIVKKNNNNNVLLKGWVLIDDTGVVLQDHTGRIKLDYNNTYKLNDRDVICLIGNVTSNQNEVKLKVKSIELINAATKKVSLEYTEEHFLHKSYQYYHEDSKINLLKNMNKVKQCVSTYLTKNKFLEINNPLLWTSVQEYGKQELKVIDPSSNNTYFLPQSPNIQNLISVIGGIERNYQFNHCFRVKEEEGRTDTVYEFTQLAITSAFMSSNEGRGFIEAMIGEIIKELGYTNTNHFKTIDYEDSIRLYGDDKPDFRYQYFYTPNFSIIDSSKKEGKCSSLLIPFKLSNDFIQSLSKLLNKKLSNVSYSMYQYLGNGNINWLAGNEQFNNIQNDILVDLDFKKDGIFILVKGCSEYEKKLLKSITSSIYPLFYKDIPELSMCWVVKYPYIDDRKNNESAHDNIGQNIFTKIEDDFYDSSQGDYYKCHTCGVDLVINGVEIASGGEKEHRIDVFEKNLERLQIDNYKEKYHFYLEALQEGAPPFFSIGIGWERLLWVLLKPTSFQELFIFPKDSKGCCKLTKCNIKN